MYFYCWLYKISCSYQFASGYIYNTIAEYAKKEFLKGKYELNSLNKHGQRVSILVEMTGKRDKTGRLYRFISGWMAYPNGKLHNNTPFSRFAK